MIGADGAREASMVPAPQSMYSPQVPPEEFTPQNELERALVAASRDPAARLAFYRTLVESKLFVIDRSPPSEGPVNGVLQVGRQVSLDNIELGGISHVPVFSSLERIQQLVEGEVRFLAMEAKDLFDLVRGSHVVLNPGLDYGKQFVPQELEEILDGSIFAGAKQIVVEKPTQVLLGQPDVYPKHITDALAAFFKTRSEVAAAYLAHYVEPASGEEPHTLIGIDCTGSYDAVLEGTHSVLLSVARKGELVDLIRIGGDSDVSRYLAEETKPFYKRKRFGLF
jgi:SseB protein C-terminal domain/SseB protein N-terminal domain